MHYLQQLTFLSTLILFLSACSEAPPSYTVTLDWTVQNSGTNASIRGAAVDGPKTAWISGAGGTYVSTTDDGLSWQKAVVPGADSLDFRDIAVFDNIIYLMAAGEGENTRVYKSTNGGDTWDLQLVNPYPKGFFSSMGFWDAQTGVVFSDPIDGKFVLFRTLDGRQWTEINNAQMPAAKEGEYAFAASGTCLITWGDSHVWIGSGGSSARVFRSGDRGNNWTVHDTPMMAGEPSTGIFGLAFKDSLNGVAVGGDYAQAEKTGINFMRTSDGGRTWQPIQQADRMPFRSWIGYMTIAGKEYLITTGPSGSDYSTDNGNSWQSFSDTGFHTADIHAPSNTLFAAGSEGRVAKLNIQTRRSE